jgi:Type VI secretion system/phage-baseplate injector OB domain
VTLAIDRISPEIKVDGQAMPDSWLASLVGMRIERGLCVVGRAVLRFSDNGYQLSAATKFDLGTAVTIAMHSGESLFSGVVTGAALEQVAGAHPELVVTVDDLACKLAFNTKIVAAESQTFSGLATKIAQAAGLTADCQFGSMGSVVHEYLLQSSTDLAFLDTMARRANCVWWVDDKTLHVQPAGASVGTATVTLGDELLDFSVRASGLRPSSVAVNGWDPNAQTDITDAGDTPTKTADSTFVASYLGTGPATLTDATLTAGSGNPNVSAEAKALASSLNTEWHAGAVVARGTSIVDPTIVPMVALSVKNAGPASGTYTVSEIEHVLRADGFYTRFVAGPIRPSGLIDTLGNEPGDSGFTISGLVTAVVSDINDPKNQGRVKVQYTGAGGQLNSNWARVMSLGGGTSRGTVFQPETKDEVLVGFERGDSRHPVVIGGLFSENLTLAADSSVVSDGKTAYRRITSRLGHVIELGDGSSDTKQHILLQLGSGNKLRLGADKFDIEMADGQPLSIKAGSAKFAIDDQGNITIEGASITMKATQKAISIESAAGQATLKGMQGVTVQGMKVDIKADTQANVEGSAMTTIKGGVVMIN